MESRERRISAADFVCCFLLDVIRLVFPGSQHGRVVEVVARSHRLDHALWRCEDVWATGAWMSRQTCGCHVRRESIRQAKRTSADAGKLSSLTSPLLSSFVACCTTRCLGLRLLITYGPGSGSADADALGVVGARGREASANGATAAGGCVERASGRTSSRSESMSASTAV